MWEKRKMERRLAALRDHIIVCGAGETGRHIAIEFLRTGESFVLLLVALDLDEDERLIAIEFLRTGESFVLIEVERDQEVALRKLGPTVTYLIGDATDGEVLR